MSWPEKLFLSMLIINSAYYADAVWQSKEICLACMFVCMIAFVLWRSKK